MIASPLLDTQETSEPIALPTSYRAYKMLHRAAEFDATRQALELDISDKGLKKLFALENCSTSAFFTRHMETGEIRIVSETCRLRWCPLCADRKRSYLSDVVGQWIRRQQHPKLVTFTLRHSDIPLKVQIDFLYTAFQKLKRKLWFRKTMRGGIWFFQVKKSKSDDFWHPHLHCVVTGSFINKPQLVNEWESITRGSYIIDVRACKDLEKSAKHIARYSSRPAVLADLSIMDRLEVMDAMHGRRVCGTWGTARKLRLTPPKLQDKEKWSRCGSWSTVVMSKDVDENARLIFNSWKNNEPLPAGINMDHIDSPFLFAEKFENIKNRSPDLESYLNFMN